MSIRTTDESNVMRVLELEKERIEAPGKRTRDHARQAFQDAGLNYGYVTEESLQRLRNLINDKMTASGLMNGTYRCRQKTTLQNVGNRKFFAGITCQAFYFDKREAVSFNRDGFIGFAGWSDDTNVQPILAGFLEWVNELKL